MTFFKKPGCAVWELTLGCNLKCIHCGSAAGKARKNELTTKEAFQLVKDLAELGTHEVCLMGGEPLIRKDWYEIAKEVRNYDMKLSIISNGFNVTQETINKLAKIEPHAVSTSLDGGTAETHDRIRGVPGSYDKVMNYIKLSREADLPTSVITTVSKLNFKELPIIKDLLFNRFIAWQIQTASPIGRFVKELVLNEEEFYALGLYIASLKQKYTSREMPVIGAHCLGYYSDKIPELGILPKWIGCQGGISIISIQSDGGIKGCLSTPDEYIEGNIRNKDIKEIWNDPNAFAYNRQFKKEDLGPNCRDCEYGETCRGGCMSMSTAYTGIPFNTPLCFHRIEQKQKK
jgi:radical SAM protein with 4Fe4S-binding SPASM domain